MRTLNVFLVLVIMALLTNSCAPGIKFTNGKTIATTSGTNPADMEGLSKAEIRSANADLTRSVATMIDSATKNPSEYQGWKKIIVALTELTKNPDEQITTRNYNRNHSVTRKLTRGLNYNSSGISQIPGWSSRNGYDYFWDRFDPLHKRAFSKGMAELINEKKDGRLAKSALAELASIY